MRYDESEGVFAYRHRLGMAELDVPMESGRIDGHVHVHIWRRGSRHVGNADLVSDLR